MAHFYDGCVALVCGTTGTPWKFNEQRVPFRESYSSRRIVFNSLGRYGYVRATVEDKMTAAQILADKTANVKGAASTIRNAGIEKLLSQVENRDGIKFKGGSETAFQRTYMLADDTTQALPLAVWNKVRPLLAAEHIIEKSLKAAPVIINGHDYMSVTDIGPILSATQQAKFWELVRHAAADIEPYSKGAPVTVYHEVRCSLVCVADPEDKPYKEFFSRIPLELYTPNGLKGEVTVPASDTIPVTDHFLCLPGRPHESIASIYEEYVLYYSARKQICDKVCEYIESREQDIKVSAHLATANDNYKNARSEVVAPIASRKDRKRKARRLRAVDLTLSHPEDMLQRMIGGTKLEKHAFLGLLQTAHRPDAQTSLPKEFLDAMSMRFRFSGDKKETHPDLVVAAPFDTTDPVLCAYNYLMLEAAIVAKATDPACQDMQIIVMNQKDENGIGCYDDFFSKHEGYAISGYNKEYIMPLIHMGLKHKINLEETSTVAHTPYYYVHKLTHHDSTELKTAANKLILFHQKTYNRLDNEEIGETKGGTPVPTDICMATVFASAGSDKLIDFKNAEKLGILLEELGITLRTGAGDDKLMWYTAEAFINAAQNKGRTDYHVSGITTHPIARVETKHSSVSPDFTHHHIFDLIGPRQYELLKGDLLISIGGGNGTGLETGQGLLLKMIDHSLMRDKDMIYIGKDEAMYREMRSILGEEKFRDLRDNPYALQKMGIYLFDDTDAAAPQIRKSVAAVNMRIELAAHKPSGVPDLQIA